MKYADYNSQITIQNYFTNNNLKGFKFVYSDNESYLYSANRWISITEQMTSNTFTTYRARLLESATFRLI